MAEKKKLTVGQRVARNLFPCVNVWGTITVNIPYGINIQNRGPIGHFPALGEVPDRVSDEDLHRVRERVAKYIDRLIEKEDRRG